MTYQLIHGDCLEILPTLAARSIDCVITDPPYGLKAHSMRNAVGFMDVDWDESPIGDEHINAMLRMAKKQIIWGGNYFNLPPSRCFLVWDKGGAMYGRSWAECEMAWTNLDEVARIIKITHREPKEHPTQKPLQLMTWCIENFTNPGDTILDPFMGSGTTGVACIQTGRNFIGIERERKYFEIAERRISQAQPPLFVETQQQPEQGRMEMK